MRAKGQYTRVRYRSILSPFTIRESSYSLVLFKPFDLYLIFQVVYTAARELQALKVQFSISDSQPFSYALLRSFLLRARARNCYRARIVSVGGFSLRQQ